MAGDTEWNIDMEVNLFHAMRGHKPAGVNKHFQMIAIHDKFSNSSKRISSEDIWKHLSTLYDLQALNESEIVPFPNKNGDFSITDKDILDLCQNSFPRSSFINSALTDSAKPEANAKTAVKTVKPESKPAFQTPKVENKLDAKVNSTNKTDSRSNTPSSRSDQKSSSSNSSSKTSQNSSTGSTPSPSPNRRQRKRTANPSSASPATPTDSHAKRRR